LLCVSAEIPPPFRLFETHRSADTFLRDSAPFTDQYLQRFERFENRFHFLQGGQRNTGATGIRSVPATAERYGVKIVVVRNSDFIASGLAPGIDVTVGDLGSL
jgi:hypothetical protein